MTFEQTILTMINDKMLKHSKISQELYNALQKDIIVMRPEAGKQTDVDSFDHNNYNKNMV